MKKRLNQNSISHIYSTIPFLLLVLPLWCTAGADQISSSPTPHQSTCQDQPALQGLHYQVHCVENSLPTAVNTPQLSREEVGDYQLRYEDQRFDLKQTKGFFGYFDLERWQKNYGDGGVDVTGAPNVALVEGANAALITLTNQRPVMLEIDLPAEGYVRFDWKKIGGSYFSLSVQAGDQQFRLDKGLNGYYISPLLKAGDRLQLLFSTQPDTIGPTEIMLNSFCFYSNAIEVVTRKWRALEEEKLLATFTQFISVEPINLDFVVFPDDYRSAEATAIYQPASMTPDITGFPALDKDGDLQTEQDRSYLDSSNCSLEITWEDELVMEKDDWTLLRHWRVTDLVYQNVVEKTQIITLYTAPQEDSFSDPLEEEGAIRFFRTVFRERPEVRYLDWEAPED